MKVLFQNITPTYYESVRSNNSNKKTGGISLFNQNTGLVSRPDLTFHPSFGIKKSELDEYQLACANKFKPPVEKFKKRSDFDEWSQEELDKRFVTEQYQNRDIVIQEKVQESLEEWKVYLKENDFYRARPSLSLIIFDAVTSDILPDTQHFPPMFHKGVLAHTVGEIKSRIGYDKNCILNFRKMYQNNLRLEFTKVERAEACTEGFLDGNKECLWVRIPSGQNDRKNFDVNVKKLNALSCDTWCTRGTDDAEYFLWRGDFYVYLENNKPKVGIDFNGDKIASVTGERNDSKLPWDYLDEIKSFVESKGFRGAEEEIAKMLKQLKK